MYQDRTAIEQHCRDVIRECLNIVQNQGDTYVAIHKDDDVECLVLVALFRTYPLMTVVIADKLLFAKENESDMFRIANDLNIESVTGWHTLVPSAGGSTIYMYRRCLWMTASLSSDDLTDLICTSIREYKNGRKHLTFGDDPILDPS